MRRVIGVVLLMLLLSGCMKGVRLNKRGIVQAMGIDLLEDGGYRITLQVSEADTSRNSGEGAEKYLVVEKDGRTITNALSAASLSQGKQMFLGSCKLVVLGEGLAKNGCGMALNYLNDSHEINPSIYLLVAKGSAGEIIKAREEDPLLNADTILDIVNDAYKSGLAPQSRLVDQVHAINSDYGAGAMAAISLQKQDQSEKKDGSSEESKEENPPESSKGEPPKKQKEGKSSFEISGAGLFDRERLVGYLDNEQVRGLAWTEKGITSAPLVVEDDQIGRVAAITNTHYARLSIEMVGDHPVVNIHVNLLSTVMESSLPQGIRLNEQERIYTKTLQEFEIENEIEQMLQATQRQGYDILRTALLVQKKAPEYYQANAENWGETVASFGYRVDVACKVLPTV